MLGRLSTRLVLWIFHNSHISLENRALCTAAILGKLNAFPTRDIISLDQNGTILVNDRPLDMEMARKLRESAKYVLDSTARRFVREQVLFKAINIGVHNGDSTEKIMFSRVAIWWGQQEDEFYKLLAQE